MKSYFRTCAETFLEYLDQNLSYSPLTIKTYRLNLYEALDFVEIVSEEGETIVDLMPYRLFLTGKKKRTIYKKISIFKSFISYMKEQGEEIRLRHDETIKIARTLPKPVATHYIFEVLQECNRQERILLQMVYGLGLRISEVAQLKLCDIGGGWVRINGKGDKIRELPLLSNIRKELDLYLQEAMPHEYLFEKSGTKMSENQIRYRIGKIFQKKGLKVTPHQLRHAFASDLLNQGARITDVSALLGHTSLETTQIYTKLNSSAKMRHYQNAHPLCGESDGSSERH
ncbi:MAG: integrase [Sulfurospirillum sp.]|nr:MAG: integrase [Sulfurospirillum sp.]